MEPTSLSHVRPTHIKLVVDAVLRLYFLHCGCSARAVYDDEDAYELILQDWDELIGFAEDVYDGVAEIRGSGSYGLLAEEPEEHIPDTERGT